MACSKTRAPRPGPPMQRGARAAGLRWQARGTNVMKIIVVSDTHQAHSVLGTLEGNVLIHCGDFSIDGRHEELEIKALDQWFSKQRFEHILCTGGNHDFLVQKLAGQGDVVFKNADYLQDHEIIIENIKFYGSPWIPELLGRAHYREEPELIEAWTRIPRDTAVLITHTPPF